MATIRWRGDAAAVAQVNTVTPANVAIGNTFSITINGKVITYTAAAATVADVTAGLVALFLASTHPEFLEITPTDSVTLVTLTAVTSGKPFTQTSSAAGGTATNTTATSTANSGPNDWSIAANWDGGAVPISTDTVYLDNPVDILYGLAQSAVTLTALHITSTFTAALGLLEHNGSYWEYRATQLAISATTIVVGDGPGAGSRHLRINTGTAATTLIVKNTSNTPAEANTQCLRWIGTHAANVVEVLKGSVGIAKRSGTSATVATLHVGFLSNVDADAVVHCGSGTTLTTINKSGGQLTIDSNSTTIKQTGGTLTLSGGTVTTLTVDTGTIVHNSTGTITTVNIGNEGVFQRADMRAATITTVNMYKGAALLDPFGVLVYTNPLNLIRCRPTEVTIDVGEGRTLAVAG